ncbi:MAG: LacI family transcriptional regulator [Clostridiales bacterium]|jgi:DNA-binding LacI/PurR family transcriptional regulator|nr:LacI family transcriptional regulator [Clostridiales bacterium]
MNINDVSKHIGVSPATISRVMNNYDNVNPAMRERVMAGVRELGYVTNLPGRNLRAVSTKIFLICVHSIDNPFYAEIVRSIEQEAIKHDYNIMICESYLSLKRYRYFADSIKAKRADGIILLSPREEAIEYFKDVPFVVCGETGEDYTCDTVDIDSEKAGYEAVKHLIGVGARKIVCMGGNYKSGIQRIRGYKKALAEAGIAFNERLLFGELFNDYEEGYKKITELMAAGEAFDGIFACNDILATGAINALIAGGKRVPDDVRVVGFDDLIFSRMCAVPITTVRQPRKEMGETAFEILFEKTKNRDADARRVVIGHELIIRKSTV